MIRLELVGPHTRQTSTLCASCRQGRAGCCAAPPAVAWADLGRIAHLGGVAWLLDEIKHGRLRPVARGLAIERAEPSRDEGGEWPARCVYLGAFGCVIPPERRSATCNYYLCEDAFAHHGEGGVEALSRAAHEAMASLYGRWDLELGEIVAQRFPSGPTWDAELLEWLASEFRRLTRRDRRALARFQEAPKGASIAR